MFLTNPVYILRKYEEIYPPDVGEFAYITDDTYTKSQVKLGTSVAQREFFQLSLSKFFISTVESFFFMGQLYMDCQNIDFSWGRTFVVCCIKMQDFLFVKHSLGHHMNNPQTLIPREQ